MTTVFVIYDEGNYYTDDSWIVAIFSTREKAEMYLRTNRNDCGENPTIEDYILDKIY